uniref:Uncharacterized protein n=1 Tax=Setaria viridis TaxID=4556 RepID=A0A4U6V885_SETVI|nr:hypothetical protein SEVIR_3G118400v2 [Setaria viridis]
MKEARMQEMGTIVFKDREGGHRVSRIMMNTWFNRW